MPYATTSPLLQELLAAGVVRFNADNTGVVLPTGATFPLATIPAILARVLVNNNAAAAYAVPADTDYVGFTGTQVGTVAFTLPAAAAGNDGLVITIFTQAAVGVSATWVSAGATFVGAPATLAALSVTKFVYNHATLQWLRT